MDVQCEQCNARFKLADEKIPPGQRVSLPCPSCKNKITIDTRKPAAAAPAPSVGSGGLFAEVNGGSYDASERPFDFVEEGAQTALVCEQDPEVQNRIKSFLDNSGYHTTSPDSAREVLKQMRLHYFDLVVLNERFDTTDPDESNVLRYIDRLAIEIRRKMFVALISDRFRTMDEMMAFNKSVNLIINTQNSSDIDRIIKRGVADHTSFYKVFNESMEAAGKV